MTAIRFPWDVDDEPALPPLPPAAPVERVKPRGRRPREERAGGEAGEVARSWIFHHLTVFGPAQQVAGFAEAARGPGFVPWRYDYAEIEQRLFHMALLQPSAKRSLSIDGCRILARQFRRRIEANHDRAAAIGQSRSCPFDLHVLLPVPPTILALGPSDPRARDWLRANWGLSDAPRQIALRAGATASKRLPAGHRVVGYGFFTEGEMPDTAIAALRPRWPGLSFRLLARPG